MALIVADTSAIVALADTKDPRHRALKSAFEERPEDWILPWAILPEVDYMLGRHLGTSAEEGFLADLAAGLFTVVWGDEADLVEANRICRQHRALRLGLVDGVVIAVAERLKADAIATLDLRHFGAVKIKGSPKLLPRDF